jgi:hypothetical protein
LPKTGTLLLAGLLLALPASASDIQFLPELQLRLTGARFAPADQDFQWDAWIGGGAGIVRVAGVTLYGSADVETIIGDERRAFDANQAGYHLETGLRKCFGPRDLTLYFNHVSRHTEDRLKPEAVDWNALGVRFSGALATTPVPMRFSLSAGHTTLTSHVTYRFEGIAELGVDLVHRERWDVYLDARARGVTTEPTPLDPRSGFVDARVEGGVRLRRSLRNFQAFVAYEHRNDVYVDVPGVRDWALVGIRFGLNDR